ncbi:claw keratin-like [Athene cunicularia]|uniref:claw keratin-like n=1 Tax=Athene cunicularia TaxID=194338 RepID=UPI000EF729EB|nr:claw keratin-like [Athene cunicularia]
MSCSSLCNTSCGVAAPAPLADTCNEPCVRQCPDSTVVIQPPASVVTFPGPILSSFPQHSAVGSAGVPAVGSVPISEPQKSQGAQHFVSQCVLDPQKEHNSGRNVVSEYSI